MADRMKLKHPFELDGETVEAVSLRRPKVKDLRAIDAAEEKGELEQGAVMIAAVTGLSMEAVDELDTEDFLAITEKIEAFFPEVAGSKGGAASPRK